MRRIPCALGVIAAIGSAWPLIPFLEVARAETSSESTDETAPEADATPAPKGVNGFFQEGFVDGKSRPKADYYDESAEAADSYRGRSYRYGRGGGPYGRRSSYDWRDRENYRNYGGSVEGRSSSTRPGTGTSAVVPDLSGSSRQGVYVTNTIDVPTPQPSPVPTVTQPQGEEVLKEFNYRMDKHPTTPAEQRGIDEF